LNELYPYQEEGVRFLLNHDRAYLADEMGLGKTVQAARAAYYYTNGRGGHVNALVIAPASALENWRREWKEWGPPGNFAAISYSSRALRDGTARGGDWDVVILDEAHYVKNPRAKRTLAALNVARSAPRTWLLSGTPMPNHPGELWAPIRALWPEVPARLGVKSHWGWFTKFNHWTQTRYGPRPYGVKNADILREELRNFMLRRRLEDVALDLPPLRVDVSLLPKDAGFETALERAGVDPENLMKRLEAEDTEEGSTSRLRRLLGEYKAPRIGEILLKELDDRAYPKIVVLAYHRAVMGRLRGQLSPHGVVGFHGGTPPAERQEAIDTFREDPTVRVFLAQQTAAGIAINLQMASEIVLVEPDWTPNGNAQAIKRIHRIGQDRPCRARIFAVAGSLDEGLMRTVATKTRIQADVGLN